jgi:hypothetical protein
MIDPKHVTIDQLREKLPARLARWAREIWCAAEIYQLDTVVLAAIMDRESQGGDTLIPRGLCGAGDHGHGRGIMQIDDRWHAQFIATGLWQEAAFAALYGARLLRQNLDVLAGDYPSAIAAYNVGATAVRFALARLPPASPLDKRIAALDVITTGHYVAGVLKIRDELLHLLSS